jgi:glutamate/tyrosine decarboxylase-like PLP-dependent enzyme
MDDFGQVLRNVTDHVAEYRRGLERSRVAPRATRSEIRATIAGPVPEVGVPTPEVIAELIDRATPGLMASAGPRYFGFVVGGSLDAALAADLLTSGWDQVAFNEALSPASLAFEDVAGGWLKELLRIPSSSSVGFVTGAQAANTVGLAAGRWKVLQDHGWDVGIDGLFGAPHLRVVVGEERHATIDRSLRLLGIGEKAMAVVPARQDGSMDISALSDVLGAEPGAPTIVVAQSGNVNTGAFDDLEKIAEAARRMGAWLHVDGAFGLWAAASPSFTHLVDGLEGADSWGCDGHKWLNVPYDSGYAFCAHADIHATAMAYTADYLTGQVVGREFGGGDFVPESSRRARGFATWAAIRSLGKSGVADLVERCCVLARRLADGVAGIPGVTVANDVVLNQVLVRVGDTRFTHTVEELIQTDGTVWLGGTTRRGERLLRVAVSNWSTGEEDIDRTIDTIARAVHDARAERPS